MHHRTTAFALAVFAASLAGTVLTTTSGSAAPTEAATAAPAADECLAGPKGVAPQGSHWYYRTNRATKRKCWYLGDAGGKVNKAASSTSAKEPQTTPDAEQSVADARAELPAGKAPMGTARSEQAALAETTWPPMPEPTADAAPRDVSGFNTQALSAQDSTQGSAQDSTQGSNIASRWPASNSVASAETQPQTDSRDTASPALTADKLAAVAAAAPPQATSTPQQVSQPQTTALPQAAAQPEESSLTPLRLLLLMLTGALVLAAILGRVIFKYIGARRNVRNDVRSPRRAIWDVPVSDDTSAYIQDDLPLRRIAAPLNTPAPNDAAEEIEKLLLRASKRSAA